MKRGWILILALGLLVMLAPAFVACAARPPAAPPAPTAAAAGEWDKVLADARKEGKLTFYGSMPTQQMEQALVKPLAEKYGIKLEWVAAAPVVNSERIITEQRSKQYVADLFQIGAGLTDRMQDQGMLLAFTPPIVSREPLDLWRFNGVDTYEKTRQQLTFLLGPTGPLAVNTKVVKPEDMPNSYKDLLDPKWKGKIAMHDPSTLGPGSVTFNLPKRVYGLEYWEKMKSQEITFVRDFGDLARRLAVGESAIALGLTANLFAPVLAAGAPLKLIAPEEGITPVPVIFNFIGGAPHPNAAKVTLEYALSKEGQQALSSALVMWSVRKDLEFKAHPALEEYVVGAKKIVMADKKYVSEYVADYEAGVHKKVLGLK